MIHLANSSLPKNPQDTREKLVNLVLRSQFLFPHVYISRPTFNLSYSQGFLYFDIKHSFKKVTKNYSRISSDFCIQLRFDNNNMKCISDYPSYKEQCIINSCSHLSENSFNQFTQNLSDYLKTGAGQAKEYFDYAIWTNFWRKYDNKNDKTTLYDQDYTPAITKLIASEQDYIQYYQNQRQIVDNFFQNQQNYIITQSNGISLARSYQLRKALLGEIYQTEQDDQKIL